jgi:hypothetical protein
MVAAGFSLREKYKRNLNIQNAAVKMGYYFEKDFFNP